MCEYCQKDVRNKKILDIDKEMGTFAEIINQKKTWGYLLYVEIEGQDEDGYKPSQFFNINYCPMCGRKLGENNAIKTKYNIGDRVWVAYIRDDEVSVYSDIIAEITIDKNKDIGYILQYCCEEFKEDDIILITETEKLISKIKLLDFEILKKKEYKKCSEELND